MSKKTGGAPIGIDLAKRSFQLHGARADGSVAFRKKLSRDKMLHLVASHPPCVVAMETCASAHHWGREIGNLGHEVKLVPPIYVKPFVKRQKNDAADAEAICEAASRPTMRFVAVKTREPHASPCFCRHQITPKTSRYTRCSMSMLPNVSINRRTRSSGQLGRWWYSISPCRNNECVRRFTVFAFNQRS